MVKILAFYDAPFGCYATNRRTDGRTDRIPKSPKKFVKNHFLSKLNFLSKKKKISKTSKNKSKIIEKNSQKLLKKIIKKTFQGWQKNIFFSIKLKISAN
jgi:hypothetical protein